MYANFCQYFKMCFIIRKKNFQYFQVMRPSPKILDPIMCAAIPGDNISINNLVWATPHSKMYLGN